MAGAMAYILKGMLLLVLFQLNYILIDAESVTNATDTNTTSATTTASAENCWCSKFVPTNGCIGVCGVGKEELVSHCTGSGCTTKEKFRTRSCQLTRHCDVSGTWTLWTSWGICHVTCGHGVQTGKQERTRACTSPSPPYTGSNCAGHDRETTQCVSQHQQCVTPVNGGYSQWQQWGSCTATCGSHGVRERQRECNNPPPSKGGSHCTGPDRELGRCLHVPACHIGGGAKRRRGRRPRRERRQRRTRRTQGGGIHHSRRSRGGIRRSRGGGRGGDRSAHRFGGSGRSGGKGRGGSRKH